MSDVVPQALRMASEGRGAEAVALLEAAPADPDALTALALWRTEGRLVRRDLAGARGAARAAAALGHKQGTRLAAGFLAAGAGGARDWPGALALLRRMADRDLTARDQLALIGQMVLESDGAPAALPGPERISDAPDIRRFPGLFSAAECAFLIAAAESRFAPATIFHEGEGRFVADPIRRSDTAGFPLVLEGPAVHALNRRLAAASGTDVRRGETLQVLRYRPGQEYRPHLDAVPGLANQRVLTFLVWLNDDFSGGETLFGDLAIRPRRGDGLLFANTLPDGRPDPASRHAGAPVTAGTKIIASRWIRARAPGDDGFGNHEAERR